MTEVQFSLKYDGSVIVPERAAAELAAWPCLAWSFRRSMRTSPSSLISWNWRFDLPGCTLPI